MNPLGPHGHISNRHADLRTSIVEFRSFHPTQVGHNFPKMRPRSSSSSGQTMPSKQNKAAHKQTRCRPTRPKQGQGLLQTKSLSVLSPSGHALATTVAASTRQCFVRFVITTCVHRPLSRTTQPVRSTPTVVNRMSQCSAGRKPNHVQANGTRISCETKVTPDTQPRKRRLTDQWNLAPKSALHLCRSAMTAGIRHRSCLFWEGCHQEPPRPRQSPQNTPDCQCETPANFTGSRQTAIGHCHIFQAKQLGAEEPIGLPIH